MNTHNLVLVICSVLDRAEGGLRRLRSLIRSVHDRRAIANLNRHRLLLDIHA